MNGVEVRQDVTDRPEDDRQTVGSVASVSPPSLVTLIVFHEEAGKPCKAGLSLPRYYSPTVTCRAFSVLW